MYAIFLGKTSLTMLMISRILEKNPSNLHCAILSVPKENFLRTLTSDNYDIDFWGFKFIDCILLCLSLVSLVSLVKVKL